MVSRTPTLRGGDVCLVHLRGWVMALAERTATVKVERMAGTPCFAAECSNRALYRLTLVPDGQ